MGSPRLDGNNLCQGITPIDFCMDSALDSIEAEAIYDDGEFIPDSESEHPVLVQEQHPL